MISQPVDELRKKVRQLILYLAHTYKLCIRPIFGGKSLNNLAMTLMSPTTTSCYSASFVVCSNNEIINQPVRMARSNRSRHFCFYLYFIVDTSLNSCKQKIQFKLSEHAISTPNTITTCSWWLQPVKLDSNSFFKNAIIYSLLQTQCI